MGQYCDSKVLERNWFDWLLAQATPALEPYRLAGVLYSKIVVSGSDLRAGADPYWGHRKKPKRAHCIATATPVYCNSYSGKCDTPRYYVGSKTVNCRLPDPTTPADPDTIARLLSSGYIAENPTARSWSAILADVQKMCRGISLKYNLPSEDAYEDLVSEAFIQVSHKIKNLKLIYTPNKAPVFNLLTTTIHRIVCSILNKLIKDRNNRARHAELVAPLAAKGQARARGRIVTRRVMGTLIATPH